MGLHLLGSPLGSGSEWQLEPPESRREERNLHKVEILLCRRMGEWRKQGLEKELN